MKEKPKHALKDSVFKNLFSDKKYLFQLYRALHPEDQAASQDDIEDITIRPVFMGAEYNDLGFSVGDRLITLVESQSTWSVNIIIRGLLYLADTYNNYLKRTRQNLYTSKKAKIPMPELYVIYTGDKKNIPERITLRDEFFESRDCGIDVAVKILSGKYDNNIISQYIAFCKVYDDQIKLYGITEKAVKETIRICKDKDILKEYLKECESEVISIMLSLFSEEELSKVYEIDLRRRLTEEITAEVQRETAQRVERETAQRVERETAQRVERETAQRVERETAQRVERETAQRVERETAQRVERETARRVERETARRVERETAQKDARQFALKLLKLSDIPVEKIAELTNLSTREVNELKDCGI